jgi:hypothetical protein
LTVIKADSTLDSKWQPAVDYRSGDDEHPGL